MSDTCTSGILSFHLQLTIVPAPFLKLKTFKLLPPKVSIMILHLFGYFSAL